MPDQSSLKAFGIVFFGSLAASVLQYVFHLVTGRLLGPAEYGELVGLIALLTILSVPFGALGLSITKEISRLNSLGKKKEISFLVRKYFKLFTFFGIGLFILFSLLSPILASFLNSSILAIILVSFSLIGATMGVVTTSVLNGLQRFSKSMIGGFLSALAKLLFAFSFILIGIGLLGSVFSFAIGGFVGVGVSLFFLRKSFFWKQKATKFSIKKDLVVIVVALMCFNALNNLDLILAPHYLPQVDAGLYAAASEIGKVIFFLVGSLVIVLVPKAVEQKTKNEDHHLFMLKTAGIVFGVSFIGLLGYYFFPKIVVSILYGAGYAAVAPIIILTGLAMTFCGISGVLVNYFIAVDRKNYVFLLVFFIALMVALIALFHSSIYEIALMVLITNALAAVSLLAYSFLGKEKKKHAGFFRLLRNQ